PDARTRFRAVRRVRQGDHHHRRPDGMGARPLHPAHPTHRRTGTGQHRGGHRPVRLRGTAQQYAYRGPGLLLDQPEPMVTDFVGPRGLTPGVERIARAVARTHVETGAPITVHTSGAARSGRLAVDLFATAGVDLTTVVIGHAGDSNDLDYLT